VAIAFLVIETRQLLKHFNNGLRKLSLLNEFMTNRATGLAIIPIPSKLGVIPAFARKRDPESRNFKDFWMPAFASMTCRETVTSCANFGSRTLAFLDIFCG
jgi:hypothetical protein